MGGKPMKRLGLWKTIAACSLLCFAMCGCQDADKGKRNAQNDDIEQDEEIQVEETETVGQLSPLLETVGDNQTKNRAYAFIDPKEGSQVVGAVTFVEVDDGVRVIAHIDGLTPGKHGFHIHEHGDCSADDASSAGGHFNPTNQKHGGPDSAERHIGDLGNIVANENGYGHYDRVDSVITLEGEQSIIGKSVVIHEDEDDLVTDPVGNAGKRIGCGVILPTGP